MNKTKTNQMPNAKSEKQKSKRGITLIALVITVIILLILAGVAISLTIDGGGLFSKANQAATEWNSAVARENEKINEIWNILNQTGETTPTLPEGWNPAAVEDAYPSASATPKAPIPKGFTVSKNSTENTIENGLVIYNINDKTDAEIADLDWTNAATMETLRTSYDQYVWIPVDNSTTITWSSETADKTKLTSYHDSTKEAALTLTADFDAMKTSVATYGGFYISRYELNADGGSKKGKIVANANWYNASTNPGGVRQWYGLYDLAHRDMIDGTNTVLKGHMIFGSEYEKVLNFIDTNNSGYSTTAHNDKQQTVPHESGTVKEGQTGKVVDEIKNIIDFEGNLYEWTAQAYDNGHRVFRGGYYESTRWEGKFYSASKSNNNTPTLESNDWGVRQALYVTL